MWSVDGQGRGGHPPSQRELGLPLDDLTLAARLFYPSEQPRAGAVIAHGLHSSMQSAKLTRLAQALAQAGFLALMYDARGCGASPGDVRHTTISSRREEYLAAVAWLAGRYHHLPLAFLGSSLGGCAALRAAALGPPCCLVLWSTPLDLLALMRRMKAAPRPPDLPLMLADLPRHDLTSLLAVTPGILFVHGMEDEVVPMEQARWGHTLAADPKGLLLLPGADHRLSRWEDQERAIQQTLAWIEASLVSSSIAR